MVDHVNFSKVNPPRDCCIWLRYCALLVRYASRGESTINRLVATSVKWRRQPSLFHVAQICQICKRLFTLILYSLILRYIFHQVKILFVCFQPPKCDEKNSDKVQILLNAGICDHLYTYLRNGPYSDVIIFIKVFVFRTHCLCNVQVFLLV